MIRIVPYQSIYEKSWVACKALAYLYSDFFDDRSRQKDLPEDCFEDSIELIALEGEEVVGLLDIAIYDREHSLAYPYYSAEKVAYFANLAVHPDYQNQGIANKLFEVAEKSLIQKRVNALAIFTRSDANANHLYSKWGAKLICRDYLVLGIPKKDKTRFHFQVSSEEERILLRQGQKEIPYYQREGIYIVSQEKDLSLFDIDQLYKENTYLKVYEQEA